MRVNNQLLASRVSDFVIGDYTFEVGGKKKGNKQIEDIPNGIVVKDNIERKDINIIEAPVTQMAIDIKNERALNVIMLGVYVGATDAVPADVIIQGINHKFEAKPETIAHKAVTTTRSGRCISPTLHSICSPSARALT